MYPEAEERRYYQAVVDDPDDLEPRRAYARFIEPYDPDRAELIRVQIREWELRNECPEYTAELCGVIEKAIRSSFKQGRQLLQGNNARWTPRLPVDVQVGFARGFAEFVSLDVASFARHGEAILRATPLRHLTLLEVSRDNIAFVARSPLLDRLASLEMPDGAVDDECIEALTSRTLPLLRSLDFPANEISNAGVRLLAQRTAVCFPKLEYVLLERNPCDDPRRKIRTELDEFDWEEHREATPLPEFGAALEADYGRIPWLHAAERWLCCYPPAPRTF